MHKKELTMCCQTYKIELLLFLLILCAYGCQEELDIYTDNKYLPVIYCIYCPDDSIIKVRVGRTFQGEQSAFYGAKIPDSAFLASLKVTLELISVDQSILLARRVIPLKLMPDKKPGNFYESPNYCFVTNPEISFSINGPFKTGILRLTVYDPRLNRYSVGESPLNPRPELLGPKNPMGTYQASFCSETPFIVAFTNIGQAYEFKIVFYYREIGNDNFQIRDTISWGIQIPYHDDETSKIYNPAYETFPVYGDDFFKEVGKRIPYKAGVTRLFDKFDIQFYAIDPIVRVFENLYKSVLDIDPNLSSNIANGLGFFGSARRTEVNRLLLDPRSMDSLCEGKYTRKLHFRKW
jgi:hypothetical protein